MAEALMRMCGWIYRIYSAVIMAASEIDGSVYTPPGSDRRGYGANWIVRLAYNITKLLDQIHVLH